jgi:hypothetical protein
MVLSLKTRPSAMQCTGRPDERGAALMQRSQKGIETDISPSQLAPNQKGPNNRPDEKGIETKRPVRSGDPLVQRPNNRPDEKGIET